jgi:hypothetical protein
MSEFMRLSVKSFTGVADPREDETRVLFGDLFVPMGTRWSLAGRDPKK